MKLPQVVPIFRSELNRIKSHIFLRHLKYQVILQYFLTRKFREKMPNRPRSVLTHISCMYKHFFGWSHASKRKHKRLNTHKSPNKCFKETKNRNQWEKRNTICSIYVSKSFPRNAQRLGFETPTKTTFPRYLRFFPQGIWYSFMVWGSTEFVKDLDKFNLAKFAMGAWF